MVARSRIIVEFLNRDFTDLLSQFKDINTFFGFRDDYCLVYCNKNDESKVLEILNAGENRAYISNEYVDDHNF